MTLTRQKISSILAVVILGFLINILSSYTTRHQGEDGVVYGGLPFSYQITAWHFPYCGNNDNCLAPTENQIKRTYVLFGQKEFWIDQIFWTGLGFLGLILIKWIKSKLL